MWEAVFPIHPVRSRIATVEVGERNLMFNMAKAVTAGMSALLILAFALTGLWLLKALGVTTLTGIAMKGASLLDNAGASQFVLLLIFAALGLMIFFVGALICVRSDWLYEAMGGAVKAPRRNRWFLEAAYYGVYGRWPTSIEHSILFGQKFSKEEILLSREGEKAKSILRRLREKALEGELVVWGYENPRSSSFKSVLGEAVEDKVHQIIPPDHWRSYEVEIDQVIAVHPHNVWTQRAGEIIFDSGSHFGLMVNKRQVELALVDPFFE